MPAADVPEAGSKLWRRTRKSKSPTIGRWTKRRLSLVPPIGPPVAVTSMSRPGGKTVELPVALPMLSARNPPTEGVVTAASLE